MAIILKPSLLLRRVLELQPDHVEALSLLGNLLQLSKRLPEAETFYRSALKQEPGLVKAYNNLALLLVATKRLSEAETFYRRALELKPDYADAHCNLGALLVVTAQLSEAEICYRHAIELQRDYPEANFNLGILLLSLGRYTEAWPYYEYRYNPNLKDSAIKIPELTYPQWQGESLVGKSLLIWHEQGFGDCIQFVRYAPLLKERGVSCLTLACIQPLKTLLETVAGVDAVIADVEAIAPHDYWVFTLSLPLHFGTGLDTIPGTCYLHALPAREELWRERLQKENFKVGLAWKGNADNKNDANRSLPGLTTLAPLWFIPEVSFISLQKGQGEDEANNPPKDQPIISLGSEIGDFADSAAIVEQLDMVICVDTSIAHLAGAMNKPCWVLLPAMGTDWRWLRDCEDSPWYPSMRLFRQKVAGKWDEPVERIRQALAACIT